MQTIVLNADYTFLNVVDWRKAVKLVLKKKVEVIKESDFVVNGAFKVPAVMKLVYLVRAIFRNRIPYTKKNVLIRDMYVCQYCGATSDLTIDHVIPESRGGKTNFENCVACCRNCNVSKGCRKPKEARMFLRRRPFNPTVMDFLACQMKTLGVQDYLNYAGAYDGNH